MISVEFTEEVGGKLVDGAVASELRGRHKVVSKLRHTPITSNNYVCIFNSNA